MTPNVSPESVRVEALTEKELNDEVSKLAGRRGSWTKSLDLVIPFAEQAGLLKHPRYFGLTRAGSWMVREHFCKQPISKDSSLAVAICRALVILMNGKGKLYSEHTGDSVYVS